MHFAVCNCLGVSIWCCFKNWSIAPNFQPTVSHFAWWWNWSMLDRRSNDGEKNRWFQFWSSRSWPSRTKSFIRNFRRIQSIIPECHGWAATSFTTYGGSRCNNDEWKILWTSKFVGFNACNQNSLDYSLDLFLRLSWFSGGSCILSFWMAI